MPSSVKLTYFNIRGIAETIRMLLKYGGIDFEDVRVEFNQWPKLKESQPFGQLPVYEEHGKVAYQSTSIARYLAKKVKLIGENDWEDLQIDVIVDTINDLRQKIIQYKFETNEELKEKLKTTLHTETLPYYLERLEKIAKENNEHLALAKLTWADIFFAASVDTMSFFAGVDILENRPYLKAVRDNVHEIPAIKDWVDSRPKTDY